jgi:hypothetical protein
MVGGIARVVGAVVDAGEKIIGADWICATSMVMAVKPVVLVIWPTMNMRLSALTVKSRIMTIWFA